MQDKSGARLRAAAAEAVDAVVVSGRSLDTALKRAEARVAEDDWPLLRLLTYGAIRFHWRLRAQLGVLLDRPLKRKDSVVESLLAIGIYQLTDTRVPDHAAVSMTVDATKVLRRPKFAALVNAVLRNFLRRGLKDRQPDSDEERFNHPDWMIAKLRDDWPDHWEDILAANNDRAPMWLRVNRQRADRDEFVELVADANPETLAGLDDAIRLGSSMPVSSLPGFADGRASVQDGAAQLAAPWLLAGLDIEPGTQILDACAAPGGKTAHLRELAPEASVTAIDIDPERVESLRENLARLGLDATLAAADASTPTDWWQGELFRAILLDAPCSASGVIRRHPDIKLVRRSSDIAALGRIQAQLLDALWPLLAPGGRLLYVTCSVFREENEAVIRDFMGRQSDANFSDLLPNNNIRDLMYPMDCGFQILPGREGLDGFYFAHLEKSWAPAA